MEDKFVPNVPRSVTPSGTDGDEVVRQTTASGNIEERWITWISGTSGRRSPAAAGSSQQEESTSGLATAAGSSPQGEESPEHPSMLKRSPKTPSTPRQRRRRSLDESETDFYLKMGDSGSECDSSEDDEIATPTLLRRIREAVLEQELGVDDDELVDELMDEEWMEVKEEPGERGMAGQGHGPETVGPGPPGAGDKAEQFDFSWSDDFTTFSGREETYQRTPGPRFASQDPAAVFMQVWDRPVMEMIVEETNRYAWQTIAALSETDSIPKYMEIWEDTTVEELYLLFAVLIYASICMRTSIRDYWSVGVLGMPGFRSLISRSRYELLSKFLHFVDNATMTPFLSTYDKRIFKIAPILDYCNNKFSSLYTPKRFLSLDESLLLWKGQSSWVQAIQTKAARRGMKFYDLCEAETGYLLRTLLYAGKNSSNHPEPIDGFANVTAKVVLELMDGYLDVGHCLVMDNWYNQLPLTRYLKARKTDVIGTISRKRLHVPDAIKHLNDREMPRGKQVAVHCSDISLLAWKDVRLVTVLSSYHNAEGILGRRKGQDFMKPKVIQDYNKYMGGVDSKDQKLSMYLMERKRNKKWYTKVFKRMLNTSILNSYIIYLRNPMFRPLTHREFRYKVAEGLVQQFRVATEAPSTSTTEPKDIPVLNRDYVRLDKHHQHFPMYTELSETNNQRKNLRCVRCTLAGKRKQVSLKCKRCNVALCVEPCWMEYHTLPNLKAKHK